MDINIDTKDRITDLDRRVLAALIAGDDAPLVMPRNLVPEEQPSAGPPSPTPAPAAFMERLGAAVAQTSRGGVATEARLPVTQQAGVRTSSTMPDDDDEPTTTAAEPVRVPREQVEGDAATAGDFESAVMHGLQQPPVRHTSP
jgi:hypothetical protein